VAMKRASPRPKPTGKPTGKPSGKTGGKSASGPKKKAARSKAADKTTPPEESARELALAIAAAGLEHKALNVEIIDVRGKVDYSDYVVVMSGRSDRQVNALSGNIEKELHDKLGARCIGIEGTPHGNWLLMDYGDVIVHIFHQDLRGYYDLESLWIDAARVDVEAD
jgi:ribosome-associated protein